ncbi:hypothetical protein Kfla_3425 [Kribbella flavida DSM 17836]|uniref:Uncharacterized protein n=1 Tax=Kribbella flavida (strain DSM 17836 / JCM 10339 / NBRC 14399) TaxID=479435 RepID=D2PLQ3_KRIFD|nr:hypothetical protein [Kribbella flavida]ADB32483.1 hypothetical protein Kfla_3425 [Kribbella flavida DSM 17836]
MLGSTWSVLIAVVVAGGAGFLITSGLHATSVLSRPALTTATTLVPVAAVGALQLAATVSSSARAEPETSLCECIGWGAAFASSGTALICLLLHSSEGSPDA